MLLFLVLFSFTRKMKIQWSHFKCNKTFTIGTIWFMILFCYVLHQFNFFSAFAVITEHGAHLDFTITINFKLLLKCELFLIEVEIRLIIDMIWIYSRQFLIVCRRTVRVIRWLHAFLLVFFFWHLNGYLYTILIRLLI